MQDRDSDAARAGSSSTRYGHRCHLMYTAITCPLWTRSQYQRPGIFAEEERKVFQHRKEAPTTTHLPPLVRWNRVDDSLRPAAFGHVLDSRVSSIMAFCCLFQVQGFQGRMDLRRKKG